ncbi:MAG TPA: type II toxin-antitoxin system RelE/ParE family toxin [Nitrospirota bacterium]|nr:type II toxin-antitoxin system RelE/ParE family toxin [Nitrospirota bacterium]
MSDKCTIRYLPVAVDDLLSIYDWIAGDSPARAATFTVKLDKLIGALTVNPHLGRVPKHDKLAEYGYRVLIIEFSLVFYVIHGRTIEIHRVVHGSRHLDDII